MQIAPCSLTGSAFRNEPTTTALNLENSREPNLEKIYYQILTSPGSPISRYTISNYYCWVCCCTVTELRF